MPGSIRFWPLSDRWIRLSPGPREACYFSAGASCRSGCLWHWRMEGVGDTVTHKEPDFETPADIMMDTFRFRTYAFSGGQWRKVRVSSGELAPWHIIRSSSTRLYWHGGLNWRSATCRNLSEYVKMAGFVPMRRLIVIIDPLSKTLLRLRVPERRLIC